MEQCFIYFPCYLLTNGATFKCFVIDGSDLLGLLECAPKPFGDFPHCFPQLLVRLVVKSLVDVPRSRKVLQN